MSRPEGGRRVKKKCILLLGIFLLLTLSACGSDAAGETLYRLPRLPNEYESLEQQIDALLAAGAEHTAPTSGNNLQSVQMVDLDSDGVEEAVAFFRKSGDEKPLKLYIFRALDDVYQLAYTVESSSDSIYSIAYNDLDGDGFREILIGFRSSLDVQSLSVISLRAGEPETLLTTGYFRYIASDMDGESSSQELIVVRSDEENLAVADYYAWTEKTLELRSSIRLSMASAEVARMTGGTLTNGETALFVTGTMTEGGQVTDILAVRGGNLQSISAGAAASGEVSRFAALYPADINGDGITEVSVPVAFPKNDPEGETYYRIFWRQYDEKGEYRTVYRTLHNVQDGWSLVLPKEWDNTVAVTRQSTTDCSTVSFYRYGTNDPASFLEISVFTDTTHAAQPVRDGRLLLARQTGVIYSAEIFDADMISEETLCAAFALLTAEWTTGEN